MMWNIIAIQRPMIRFFFLLNKSILHHLSNREEMVTCLYLPFIMITVASVLVCVSGHGVVASSGSALGLKAKMWGNLLWCI